MSDERKLFSQADEFDFKRKFVIAYMAAQYPVIIPPAVEPSHVRTAYGMANKWWDALVEHGVNDTTPVPMEAKEPA